MSQSGVFSDLLRNLLHTYPSERLQTRGNETTVRNKASPSDNGWLKLLRFDWFQNLSDKLSDTEFGQGSNFR